MAGQLPGQLVLGADHRPAHDDAGGWDPDGPGVQHWSAGDAAQQRLEDDRAEALDGAAGAA